MGHTVADTPPNLVRFVLPGKSGFDGTNATSSPTPALLARGDFTTINEVVELEATGEGATVTGRMTVSAEGQSEPYALTVDLQCARTSEDGLITIGGVTTDSTGQEAPQVYLGRDRPPARSARGGDHLVAGIARG